jgi:hypothetical protein
MNERQRRSRHVWSWVYLGIALLAIWCHWSASGRGLPQSPTDLVWTSTAYVLGVQSLPYVVVDRGDVAPQWLGLGVGIALSVLAAYVRKRLMDWVDRSEAARAEVRPDA